MALSRATSDEKLAVRIHDGGNVLEFEPNMLVVDRETVR